MNAEQIRDSFNNLPAKRVTVMGLGHFGGQIAAVQFLIEQGARVTVTDLANSESLAESLRQIEHLPLDELHLDGHREADFVDTDLILASPAVPPHNPFLQLSQKQGIAVTTEIALFWHFNPARVIGITGTIGKSTTAAMIQNILQQNPNQNTWLRGNIGRSLLPELSNIQPEDWLVLELSSFQLYYLN